MQIALKSSIVQQIGFCPGVRVYKGIAIVLSLFKSHWFAIVYCLVLCSRSCEPVYEDRTNKSYGSTLNSTVDSVGKIN